MLKVAIWVTTDGNLATVGRVRSAHQTRMAAQREATRASRSCKVCGGSGLHTPSPGAHEYMPDARQVEPAMLMALVQSGMTYTDAHQTLAGVEYVPVLVDIS